MILEGALNSGDWHKLYFYFINKDNKMFDWMF